MEILKIFGIELWKQIKLFAKCGTITTPMWTFIYFIVKLYPQNTTLVAGTGWLGGLITALILLYFINNTEYFD